jgi:hypothetical protein
LLDSIDGVLVNCEEFQHLYDEYERWRRVWARYAFPLPGQIPHGLDELKEEALLNRKITAKAHGESPERLPYLSGRLAALKAFGGK